MTRGQIRQKIIEIIYEETLSTEDRLEFVEDAADEIMKLFDQGFSYEIPSRGVDKQ